MKPSEKSPEMEQFLEDAFGRTTAIENNCCVPEPMGCGQPINPTTDFTDELSRKDYTITGLCQKCQDALYGNGSDDHLDEGYQVLAVEKLLDLCQDGDFKPIRFFDGEELFGIAHWTRDAVISNVTSVDMCELVFAWMPSDHKGGPKAAKSRVTFKLVFDGNAYEAINDYCTTKDMPEALKAYVDGIFEEYCDHFSARGL